VGRALREIDIGSKVDVFAEPPDTGAVADDLGQDDRSARARDELPVPVGADQFAIQKLKPIPAATC